jgi:hypothetical protein
MPTVLAIFYSAQTRNSFPLNAPKFCGTQVPHIHERVKEALTGLIFS